MPSPTQRGQGQWAVGHLEPLNAAERFKKDDNGLNVRAHPDSLRPAGLRVDRPVGSSRQVPLVGAVHPAPAGDRGRPDGRVGRRGDRGLVLHDAAAHSRRPALRRATAHGRRHRQGVRPRPGRRHRPAERAVPLDQDRGRPGDLGAARGGRAVHPAGVRRRAAQHPRLPGGGHRRRRRSAPRTR